LNAASFADPLPDALWDALRAKGLLRADAPVPRSMGAGTDIKNAPGERAP
jgi:D-threo-aldose 1-dehydrogenase